MLSRILGWEQSVPNFEHSYRFKFSNWSTQHSTDQTESNRRRSNNIVSYTKSKMNKAEIERQQYNIGIYFNVFSLHWITLTYTPNEWNATGYDVTGKEVKKKNIFTLQLLRLMAYVKYSLNISIPIHIHSPATLGSFDPMFSLFYSILLS